MKRFEIFTGELDFLKEIANQWLSNTKDIDVLHWQFELHKHKIGHGIIVIFYEIINGNENKIGFKQFPTQEDFKSATELL